MEQLSTITTVAIALLTPYLTKGTEEFIKAAGKDGYEKAKTLYGTLKARWKEDREATASLERFKESPTQHEQELQGLLNEDLAKDSRFATELSQLLKDLGPQIKVVQRMQEAKNVTGVEAEEMNTGDVNIGQEIDKGENVTGASFKRIG